MRREQIFLFLMQTPLISHSISSGSFDISFSMNFILEYEGDEGQ